MCLRSIGIKQWSNTQQQQQQQHFYVYEYERSSWWFFVSFTTMIIFNAIIFIIFFPSSWLFSIVVVVASSFARLVFPFESISKRALNTFASMYSYKQSANTMIHTTRGLYIEVYQPYTHTHTNIRTHTDASVHLARHFTKWIVFHGQQHRASERFATSLSSFIAFYEL